MAKNIKKIPKPALLSRPLPSKISCFQLKFRGSPFEEPAVKDLFSMHLKKTPNMIVKRKGLQIQRLNPKPQERGEKANKVSAQSVIDVVPNRFVQKLKQKLRRNNSVEDLTDSG
jgi:hypothetical protein